jgi:hypothetical protein
MIPKITKLRRTLVLVFKCLAIENYQYIFERERMKKEEVAEEKRQKSPGKEKMLGHLGLVTTSMQDLFFDKKVQEFRELKKTLMYDKYTFYIQYFKVDKKYRKKVRRMLIIYANMVAEFFKEKVSLKYLQIVKELLKPHY